MTLALGLLAGGCLEDHPVVGGGNVVDLKTFLSAPDFPPGMDSAEVQLADDSLRPVRFHWSGRVEDLDRMPPYLRGDHERVRLHLRGFRASGMHCYTAAVDDRWADRRELLNTCSDTPSVELTIKESVLFLGDSLLWSARANVKYGILSRWRLETGWGYVATDSLPVPNDSAFVLGRLPGQTEGRFPVTYSIWTRTGIVGRAVDTLEIRARIGPVPPPKILSITAVDTAVSVNDTVTFHATIQAFGSSIRYRWAGQERTIPVPRPGEPQNIEFQTGFKDAGWQSLELKLTGAAPSETASGRSPAVHVLLDPPVIEISRDTTVTAGTPITLKATAVQRFGMIAGSDWRTPGGFLKEPGLPSLTISAPDTPGVYAYIFRAWDDDGNISSAVTKVTVVADSGAYLASLAVSSHPLSPSFQPSILTYTVQVPYESTMVVVAATAKSAACSLFASGISYKGTGNWPLALKPGPTLLPISVTDAAGRKVSYTVAVVRRTAPTEPIRFAYATIYVDPMSPDRPPAVWDSYSSNGKGPAFVIVSGGTYDLVFPGIYQGTTNQPNVQVAAQGSRNARCVVNHGRGMDGDANLTVTCYGTNGLKFNSGFTVLITFPRAAAAGPNAHAQVDTLPGAVPRAPDASYNSAGKPVTVQSMEKGVYSTVFEGFPPANATTPLVTRLGAADGWCGADTVKASGSGSQVIVRCFDRSGVPEDARFSLALPGPLGDGLAFDLAYARCQEQSGGPGYNSAAGGVQCQGPGGAGGQGKYGVVFVGIGFQARSAAGNVQVSVRAKDGKTTCQVVDWQGWPSAQGVVTCFDRSGNPVYSDFHVWYIKAR